jgi:hypothetical protein
MFCVVVVDQLLNHWGGVDEPLKRECGAGGGPFFCFFFLKLAFFGWSWGVCSVGWG